ncbi:MAG: DUF3293 domain-containing protein [Actinobacteria bacterium]|nr:DUF3293 domain-containing protein [Actinomycetota bacterium]
MRPVEHDIWSEYALTLLDVLPADKPSFTATAAEPGQSDEWPFATAEVWVITACNPGSVAFDEAENAQRHEQMRQLLLEAGVTPVETVGRQSGGMWKEEGFLIEGMAGDDVINLARQFGQNAVFHWTPSQWVIVGVLQPGRWEMGWRLLDQ